MLNVILGIVVVAIAGVLILAARKPDRFTIRRSTVIAAPSTKVFPLINDLKGFNTWNPFLAMEPSSKLTYEGPAQGVGAAYAWLGQKTGAGRMEISRVVEPTKLEMKLDFTKPMKANNTVDFTLEPQGNGQSTKVTWSMSGVMPFVHKVMNVFFDSDKMVGGEFEKGLASLKALAEKS